MITIKIDNRIIDIDPDLAITFNWINPLFSEDGINEGYSYSFTLPLTARNKRLIDTKKQDLSVQIYFKGILLETGRTVKVKDNTSNIEVNILTEGSGFRRDVEGTLLPDLTLDIVPVCSDADSPTEKLDKWKAHMEQILAEAEPKYQFPQMLVNSYFDELGTDEANSMFESMGGRVNAFVMGEVRSNYLVPASFGSGKEWATTVAPCPMVDYLLKFIIKYFGFKLKHSDLEQIQEYKQLLIFNNYVKDRHEIDGADSFNTHGTEINLTEHVPKCDSWKVFKLVNELYDCYFVVNNKRIHIYSAKQQLQGSYTDFSKYVLDGVTNEDSSIGTVKYIYPIDEQEVLRFRDPLNAVRPFAPQFFPEETSIFEEKTLSHEALKSTYGINSIGFDLDFDTHESAPLPEDRTGTFEYQAIYFQNQPPKSDEYDNDAEIFELLKAGYFRGLLETVEWIPGEPEPSSPIPHPFAYSFKELMYFAQNTGVDIGIDYSWGAASIYLNGEDNMFDFYKLQKLKLISGDSITRTKILKLSLAQLLQLKRWERTKHYISQKNQSFKGIVKELTFTVTNKGISPASVSYYVASSSKRGEFSDDYTNDFNT
jgi:hypothetical protein